MKLFPIIAAVVLLGCSSPRRTTRISVPVPGGGSQIVSALSPEPSFRASAARLAIIPWRYNLPQGTVPSNYWWNFERTTNIRSNWTVAISNASEIPIISTDKPYEFFRLTGRP